MLDSIDEIEVVSSQVDLFVHVKQGQVLMQDLRYTVSTLWYRKLNTLKDTTQFVK